MSEVAEYETDQSIVERIPATLYISVLGLFTIVVGYGIDVIGWPTIGGLVSAYGLVMILLGLLFWGLIKAMARTARYTR